MKGLALTPLDEAALLDNAQGWAVLVRDGAYEDLKALLQERGRLSVLITEALGQERLAQKIIDSKEPSLRVWFGEVEVHPLAVAHPNDAGESSQGTYGEGRPSERSC